MPLGFTVTKTLLGRSERVKSVEIHPHEPWVLAGLYSGHVWIWNSDTGSLVRSFEVSDVPVRCAKFVLRKKWIVCGSDDMMIRVYNYNTHEKVKEFEAHTDYIRCITIHPSLPYILTSSDDMSTKLWDWEKGWENTVIFEGHTHYVMQIEINPRETGTFASASLDRTIRVWNLTSTNPNFTLEGHERGVNCVSYYPSGDRPWLVSGADDHTVKIWDYQNKQCLTTLEGHGSNVSAVAFHPSLPIILSGSEDNTVRVWHSSTYQWEDTLNYAMDRCWSISALDNSNKVAFGYDLGTVMVCFGQEEPVASMDRSGKITFARGNELFRKMITRKKGFEPEDGEVLPLPEKELKTADRYPQLLKHNCKGNFLAVTGDGEYTIYSALKLANKTYGPAKQFVWSDTGAGTYATLEAKGKITLFKKFEKVESIRPQFAVENIFGGHLLGVKSEEFIDFYDWDELRIVRRIDVVPEKVFWSDTVCILCCEEQMYVLEYVEELVHKFFAKGVEVDPEQGIENAFQMTFTTPEKVTSGAFEGDVFFYTNQAGRLNYLIGEKTVTVAHLDKSYYILGYFPKTNRVYLMDKNYNIIAYKLQLELLFYQVAIVRGDFEEAEEVLKDIDESYHTKLARFLEQNGHHQLALEVTTDPDHKFELALHLKNIQLAREYVEKGPSPEKWRQLTDTALAEFEYGVAEEAATKAGDLSSLLLIHSSLGNRTALAKLGGEAAKAGRYNIAFTCFYLTHRLEECLQILMTTKRYAEAAMFCRSFLPDKIDDVVVQWQTNLSEDKPDVAATITCPGSHPEMWPLQEQAMKIQSNLADLNYANSSISASQYNNLRGLFQRDLFASGVDPSFDVSAEPAEMAQEPPQQEIEEEEEEVVAADEPVVDEPEVAVVEEAEVNEEEPEIEEQDVAEPEIQEDPPEEVIDDEEDIFGDEDFGDIGDDTSGDIAEGDIDDEELNLEDFGDFD